MRRLLILLLALCGVLAPLPLAADAPQPLPGQPRSDQFEVAPWGNLDQFNPASRELRETGVFRFRYEIVSGCSVAKGLELKDSLFAAIANADAELRISIVEDPNGPWVMRSSCGVAFSSVCGNSTACLGRGFPYRLDVDMSDVAADYFTLTQISIWLHEVIGHAAATWNEQYCIAQNQPAGCAAQFSSVPNWLDFMNTGPASRHLIQPLEYGRWQRTMGSPSLKVYGSGANASGLYLFACRIDAKATRLSILYDDGAGRYWSGIILPIQRDANGCQGFGEFDGMAVRPGRCYYLKQENAATWFTNRFEVLVTCS